MVVRGTLSGRLRVVLAVLALLASACRTPAEDAAGENATTEDSTTTTIVESSDSADPKPEPETGQETEELNLVEPTPDDTPLEVSEDIRVGVLDNGLTYYVQSNDSPGGSVSMRLVVNAGAVNEEPLGTGAAHFLEHMMFNGTEKYPGNSLDAALRRIGAEIGPDFNAYTSATETVYQIEVPDQGDNVSVALDVLKEWASAALIEADEVAAEAPVVREEIRVRDESGEGLINLAFEQAYYADTPYEGVDVSGGAASVNALTEEDLRDFYDTWYRPDNMAIIAVGDRSLDELEDEIIEVFSGIEARGEILEPPSTSDFALRAEPYVKTIIEPSFGDSYVSIDFPIRAWDPGTAGGKQLGLTEAALGIMINNRISEGVDSGRLDLRRGHGGHFAWNRDLAYMGFNVDADDLVGGTEVLMTELRASVENPFSQKELERAIAVLQASDDQRLAQYGSVQDRELAGQMVAHYLSGADLQAIEESHELTSRILKNLDLTEVNDHYAWMMNSSAPIILVVGPDAARVGTVDDHIAAVERAAVAEIEAFDDSVEEITELLSPPEPVRERAGTDLAVNEGFELEFDNGIRVLFSPSTISERTVILVSESPGGRSELSDADGAVAPAAVAAVSASGVGAWDPVQVRRFLADREVDFSPYIADYSEGFSGSSATVDIDTLFSLFHLSIVDPRVDSVPFNQQLEFARDQVDQVGLDSSWASYVAMSDARTGGGNLAASPTRAQLDALTVDDAERIYTDRFSSLDDHVVVIVGDVEADVVVDLARTYIGTLPAPTVEDDPEPLAMPSAANERLSVGSGTSTGSYRLLYVAEFGEDDVRARVTADLAQRVLNDRIFTVIREELGATYGGNARFEFSHPGDQVELFIAVDGDPDRIDEIADTVAAEIDILRSGGITEDDFAEAVAVLGSELGFINNGFIIESLFDEAYRDDADVISRFSQVTALQGITRNEVTSFLADVTNTPGVIDVRNVPE